MGFTDWVKGVFGREEDDSSYDVEACGRCGIEYPTDVMTPSGAVFFCNECLIKKKKEDEDLERQRAQAAKTAVIHYKCGTCKFAFKRKEEFDIKICPNCGGTNFFAEGKSFR